LFQLELPARMRNLLKNDKIRTLVNEIMPTSAPATDLKIPDHHGIHVIA
jgi:hypothetical protein